MPNNPAVQNVSEYSVVITDDNDNCIQAWKKRCGPWVNSNNEAEYEALKIALEWVSYRHVKEQVTVYTDSKLVFGHLMKGWKCQEKFFKWIGPIRVLLGNNIKLEWIPREQNKAGKLFEK